MLTHHNEQLVYTNKYTLIVYNVHLKASTGVHASDKNTPMYHYKLYKHLHAEDTSAPDNKSSEHLTTTVMTKLHRCAQ